MKKLLKVALPVLAAVMLTSAANASTVVAPSVTKVGVVDMQQIMQKSPDVATINKDLQAQFEPRQKKLAAAQADLQSQLEKLNGNTKMDSAERTKLQDQFLRDKNNFQTMAQSYQRDLSAAQSAAMQKFMNQFQTAVNNVARQGGYTLIVQRAAVPYADPGLDVTASILKAMPTS